jgi:hypothetical protein
MTESSEKKAPAERAADLSEEMLESLEARQQASIDAVRKFASTLDEAIPNPVDPSLRKTIIDAALDLADKLGTTQYEFLRSVVRNASEAVSKPGGAKE